MDVNNALIDEIVGNVMRELSSDTTTDSGALPQSSASNGSVVISSQVITEDVLIAGQATCGTIVIPAGAVITPSGRDYIRKHRITLTNASVGSSNSVCTNGLVILAAQSNAFSAAASAAGWETSSAKCANGLAQKAATSAASGRQALTCCHQPSLTACLVNRDADRRAAVVTPQMATDKLIQQMNPDVICVSPDGWSFGGTMRLLKELTASGLDVPQDWKELST